VDSIPSVRGRHDLSLGSIGAGGGWTDRQAVLYTIVPQSLAINDGVEGKRHVSGAKMTTPLSGRRTRKPAPTEPIPEDAYFE
jgi:hypothetical protein